MNLDIITNLINSIFKAARKPLIPIPGGIMAAAVIRRPGVSPMLVASNVIRRQSEAGAPIGPNADGSRNIAEAMEVIRVEEIVDAISKDGKIEIVIPPGTIQVFSQGSSPSGPVITNGFNTNNVLGYGIIR